MWPHIDKLRLNRIVDGGRRYPLRDLRDFSNAVHLLSDPATGPSRFELKLADKVVYAGNAKITKGAGDWEEIRQVTENAWELANRASICDSVCVSLTELMQNKDAILHLNAFYNGANAMVRFDDRSCYFPDQRVGFVRIFCVLMGNLRLAGVFAIVGTASLDGDAFSLKTQDVRFFRSYGEASSVEWRHETEAGLVKIASDTLEAEGIIAILPQSAS
jgi:hypothetical protein